MGSYAVIFELIAVAFVLVLITPLYALIGWGIYVNKRLSGKRGALLGALVPLIGVVVGMIPYCASTVISFSMDTQIGIGVYGSLASIPIGIIALIAIQIVAKSPAQGSTN